MPRQALIKLIRNDSSLAQDSKRLRGFLADVCTKLEDKKYVNAILAAQSSGVVTQMNGSKGHESSDTLLPRLSKSLADSSGLRDDIADWSISAWAEALGIDSNWQSPQVISNKVTIGDSDKKAGERLVLKIRNVEYAFRWCPAGTFRMGSPQSEPARADNETRHKVTLTKGFWMGETPVTQLMWESVLGNNPSHFKGAKLPVETVTWGGCIEFIEDLNDTGVAPSGFKFSLPTEAQWEYACRAGTATPFSFGGVLNGDKANCNGNYPYGTGTKGKYLEKTAAVGSYPANAWGLYDMHGNVSEWCNDWYDGDYPTGSVTDPTGATSGSDRVSRGSGWSYFARHCRSAFRNDGDPSSRGNSLGFRLSLVSERK